MVDKLKAILELINEDKRNVLLFAVLKIDEITDRWSIVYSESDITDEKTRKETFLYLANKLIANLDKKDINTIARVAVSSSDNHLVEALMQFKSGYEIKESTPVNGNIVHEGYILSSKSLWLSSKV